MARILVIDDDVNTRELLKELLTAAGHEVVVAENGRRGVDLMNPYTAQPARIIITDMFMPEKNGVQTIMELRGRFPEAGIIAISGEVGTKSLLGTALQCGADKTVQKPFEAQEILAAVAEVLNCWG
jgi:DNA-binding response OmpR family regulator